MEELLRKINQCSESGSTELYLSRNQLTELPPEIGKLTNLQSLDLSVNQLTELPPEIWKLTNLQTLDLRVNRLTELPPEIGKLTNLQTLDLRVNRLTVLPPEIGKLKNLIGLELSLNKLDKFSPAIEKLTNLQALGLSGSQLTELPPEIGKLTNLQTLGLSYNQLIVLPPEIGKLTNLKVLNLEGNPLNFPPAEIVRHGTEAVLYYLRDILEAKTSRYEAKLCILGDGGEGKTCLSRALRGIPFASQHSTKGVDIEPWVFPHPEDPGDPGKKVTLNLWDFEGQEINHQSHQFFLTKRSLYILVFNARIGYRYDRIEYWLNTIRTRAPKSTVIIVATECGKATPAVNIGQLKAEYGDLLKTNPFYFATECETDTGIPALVKKIHECVADKNILPIMGEPWPQSYGDAEKTIKKKSESDNHISWSELQKIFKDAGIRESVFETVASVMGDMGTITHFPTCTELRDFIVLKPHWLTKAISLVMEDKELVEYKGERPLKWLSDKWTPDYPGLFQNFHGAMKEFELCYDLDYNVDGKKELCLVPLRFGYERPEIPWSDHPDAKERRIQFSFDKTPPAGIMSRFIVKTHYMIARPPEKPKGVFWYNGVFLRTGEGLKRSEALCEFDKEARKLSITVRSAFPQNMIEQLNGFAQAVFSFFDGLRPILYYGCVKEDESPCNGFHSEETIMFVLSDKDEKDKKDKRFHCAYGRHKPDALSLVYGFTSFSDAVSVKEDLRLVLQEELPKLSADIRKDISRNAGAVITRVNALSKDIFHVENGIIESKSEVPENVTQQVEHSLRDYLNLFADMLDIRDFTPVPSIISIVSVEKTSILNRPLNSTFISGLFENKFILTPYCEYEQGVHETNYQGKPYHIEFTMPKEWWEKNAKDAGLLFDILRVGLTVAVAASQISNPALYLAMVPAIATIDKLFNLAGGFKKDALDIAKGSRAIAGISKDVAYDLRASKGYGTDDELRRARLQLAALLEKIAPYEYSTQKWGELQRIKLKDNTYRWLCAKHADEYRKMY